MRHRLTGFDTPFGGISWDNAVSPKERISYLFFFLESKRILTNPIEMEIIEQCVGSVIEIRNTFVSITDGVKFSDKDMIVFSEMVKACNKYLDAINALNNSRPHIIYKDGDKWADKSFDTAMKEFRKSIKDGIQYFENKYNLTFRKAIPEKPY